MEIEQLIQLSPVPVEFVDTIDNGLFAGMYYHTKKHTGKEAYIEILNRLDDCEKIRTLIHEIAHANCGAKNCKCMKNPDHTKREIHANRFVLSWLLKHKQKEALKEEMEQLTQQANGNTCRAYYEKAAKHIIKLKLWHKCLDYIK